MNKLIIKDGPSAGQEFKLNLPEMTIGRDASVDIQVPIPSVSRRHARLKRHEDRYLIEDLGSSNGTFVNGQVITAGTVLTNGDQIRLGKAVTLAYESPTIQADQTRVAKPRDQYHGQSIDPASSQTMIGDAYSLDQGGSPPQFIVSTTGEPRKTYSLTRPHITIGRAHDNDVVISSNIVSRHHARLESIHEGYQLVVLPEARNPVYLDGRPVTSPHKLRHEDKLRIGSQDPGLMVTMNYHSAAEASLEKPHTINFGTKNQIKIGRDPGNDVVLAAPSISRFHAQVERVGQRYKIRDMRSSNGTFINDQRVEGEVGLKPKDTIRIGSYRFVMGENQLAQYDETGSLRVDAIGLNKWVRKDLNILKNISLSFQPREFIVIVGQSGGGKTTLVDAIAGYRPATHGKAFINDIDVYRNFDAVRNDIGYVPQKNIIHTELSVYQALDYAARLRMPPDTSKAERHQRITEVLNDLDLAHRKDVQISGLSGGQRKRVSIGVELLTKPGLFFLDEPTSGLDPGTETAFMQLMRRLADQGRTIVLITHATKNVMLADKVVFLARGGYLVWFGPPDEALSYFDQFRTDRERRTAAMDFNQIYSILEDTSRGSPQEWAKRYQTHHAYQQYVVQPLQSDGYITAPTPQGLSKYDKRAKKGVPRRKRTRVSSLRQFFILSSRNLKILTRDRFSLFLMLAIAPLIAMLDIVFLFALGESPFDYVDGSFVDVGTILFTFAIYGILVGALSQMREIVKDGPVYKRERLVNLKIFPYVMSKLWVAVLLAIYHTTAFVVIRYLVFDMPGGMQELVIIFITMFLATIAGMMLGLFASAFAPNPNSAPLMAILLILPQIVLGGALIPLPHSITSLISSRWAFETFVSITGAGSDVAADVCWSLPEELRDSMSLEDKEKYGCRCMGENVLNQETCDYPGLGSLYDPVIEQDAPIEPASIGDPPPEPIFPDPPEAPTNQTDESAVSQYVDDLGTYQDTIDQMQEDYKVQVDAYQIELDAYLDRMVNYQEEFATWQIDRNSAIAKAEGTIKAVHEDMGWAFVDKENQEIFWSKITRTWIAQIAIITALFIAILILMKHKDKVK